MSNALELLNEDAVVVEKGIAEHKYQESGNVKTPVDGGRKGGNRESKGRGCSLSHLLLLFSPSLP